MGPIRARQQGAEPGRPSGDGNARHATTRRAPGSLWSALALRTHGAATVVQTKRADSGGFDPWEREADQMADRMADAPDVRSTPERAASTGGSGQPLDEGTRATMERGFQADFSDVRVHTDTVAAEAARSQGAVAFTSGHHIAFDEGRFAPSSGEGRRLLAHELMHVVQQRQHVHLRSAPQHKPGYLVTMNFCGQSVEVNPTMQARLQTAETSMHRKYDALGPNDASRVEFGGAQKTFEQWIDLRNARAWQPRGAASASKHASGSAIDCNYDMQPYIVTRSAVGGRTTLGGEIAGAHLTAERQRVVEVYDRATQLEFSATDTADASARKAGESTHDAYQRMSRLSTTLNTYFRHAFNEEPTRSNRQVMANIEGASEDELLRTIPVGERLDETTAIGNLDWYMREESFVKSHPSWPLNARQQYFRILRDYEHVRVPQQFGGTAARPMATRNPTRGFLWMKEEFVTSMVDDGHLRWGAIDLGEGSSGDTHHFYLGDHGGFKPDGTP